MIDEKLEKIASEIATLQTYSTCSGVLTYKSQAELLKGLTAKETAIVVEIALANIEKRFEPKPLTALGGEKVGR
jgi:hypothetical protein